MMKLSFVRMGLGLATALSSSLVSQAVHAETLTSVTEYSYDTVGRLLCTAVRMNPAAWGAQTDACTHEADGSNGPDRIVKNQYDAAGQLIQVRQATGTSLEQAYATYTYTANGKQEYVIDANGNRAKMEYDGFDRPNKWIFPAQTRPASYAPADQTAALAQAGAINTADYEAYGHDANGNRTSLRKRDGSTLTFAFDALNRMTSKVVPERSGLGGTYTRDVYYGYDLRGLQTYARFDSPSGEGVSSAYDGLGRLTATTASMDSQTRQLSFAYDVSGNRTGITWPDGASLAMTYDVLNRALLIKDANGTSLTSRTYNDQGLLSANTRSGTAFDQSFGYDAVGRLSSASITDGAATSRVTWSYGRNPASQITSDVRSNDAYAWNGYYNLSRAYTTNGLNQYTAAGPATFCYDANGNLTADGGSVYLYDIENRLVEKHAQTNTDCSTLSYSGALSASLRYDPLGRLYEVAGTSTTRFLHDGDAIVGEYNASGALLSRYAHGNDVGADDPMIWFEGASALAANARHLYADPRGSIVLTGDASGNAIAINRYDEYGIPSTDNQGLFQYTGQAWLADVGMYYYKARFYSPRIGRFLQTDPIGYKDQVNLYAYAGNDPVNKTDYSGNCIEDACIGEGIAVAAAVESAGGVAAVAEATGGIVSGLAARLGTVALTQAHNVTMVVAEAAEAVAPGAGGALPGVGAAAAAGGAEVYRGSRLARNMANAGNPVTKGVEQAHHIVAQGAAAAAPARGVLARAGIGIHDAVNGAAAKIADHASTHTRSYYETVNEMLQEAERAGQSAVYDALGQIRKWFQ